MTLNTSHNKNLLLFQLVTMMMMMILSLVTRQQQQRIPHHVHSFLLVAPHIPRSSIATITSRRQYDGKDVPHICTASVRMLFTTKTGAPNERRQRLRSSSSSSSSSAAASIVSNGGGRYASSFSSRGRDKIREGISLLARSSEANSKNENEVDDDDDKFDMFEGIPEQTIEFRTGLPIIVEVLSFGPLGASVAVIGKGETHDAAKAKLTDSSKPMATGLIYQNEIRYFRESRRNVDVVLGEILPAFVERIREDGKIDVSLRVLGGRAKVDKWSGDVLLRLEQLGELPLGNKSTPMEIAHEFPGMSKGDFKKCIGALFERQLVFPFSYTVLPYEDGLAIDIAQRKAAKGLENDNASDSASGSVNINNDSSNSNSNNNSSYSYNSSRDNTRNSSSKYNSSRQEYDGNRNNRGN